LSPRTVKSSKDIPREEIPWFPTIREDKCTGCGICVEFCVHGVFEMSGKARVKKPFNCVVGCTGCLSKCPEEAISFPAFVEFRKNMDAVRRKYGLKG
jgi:NAD-dependent dihydropyrimidine dehydrogenase PreA subunit